MFNRYRKKASYIGRNQQIAEAKAYLAALKNEVMQWYPCDMLELEDDRHKIVEIEGTDIQPTIRQQYELRVDTNCALFRLGYSIENVNQMIENEI